MYRVVRASNEVQTFRNKRNPNKYIEVKHERDGHTAMRQYMQWDTDQGQVKNYTGAKDAKRGRYSRVTKDTLSQVLEDYDTVEDVNGSSNLDGSTYYIDSERNYEGTHYFVIRRNDGLSIDNIRESNELSEITGYYASLFPDGSIWIAAPSEDIDLVESVLP